MVARQEILDGNESEVASSVVSSGSSVLNRVRMLEAGAATLGHSYHRSPGQRRTMLSRYPDEKIKSPSIGEQRETSAHDSRNEEEVQREDSSTTRGGRSRLREKRFGKGFPVSARRPESANTSHPQQTSLAASSAKSGRKIINSSLDKILWPSDDEGEDMKSSTDTTHDETTVSSKETSCVRGHQASKIARLQNIRSRSPSLFGNNRELRRNLDAASVVMDEEKSSTCSSSSSRSSLSNDELQNIAKRALTLSKVKPKTRKKRMDSSPLHQMMKDKREKKPLPEKESATKRYSPSIRAFGHPRAVSNNSPSVPDQSRRIANSISRADKFSSLTRTPTPTGANQTTENDPLDSESSTTSSSGPVKITSHPVFGHSKGRRSTDYDDASTFAPRSALLAAAKKSKKVPRAFEAKPWAKYAPVAPANATAAPSNQGFTTVPPRLGTNKAVSQSMARASSPATELINQRFALSSLQRSARGSSPAPKESATTPSKIAKVVLGSRYYPTAQKDQLHRVELAGTAETHQQRPVAGARNPTANRAAGRRALELKPSVDKMKQSRRTLSQTNQGSLSRAYSSKRPARHNDHPRDSVSSPSSTTKSPSPVKVYRRSGADRAQDQHIEAYQGVERPTAQDPSSPVAKSHENATRFSRPLQKTSPSLLRSPQSNQSDLAGEAVLSIKETPAHASLSPAARAATTPEDPRGTRNSQKEDSTQKERKSPADKSVRSNPVVHQGSSKPDTDTLRWLQKNYGDNVTGTVDSSVHEALYDSASVKRVSSKQRHNRENGDDAIMARSAKKADLKQPRITQKAKKDDVDEEDIFSGLEEATSRDEASKNVNHKKALKAARKRAKESRRGRSSKTKTSATSRVKVEENARSHQPTAVQSGSSPPPPPPPPPPLAPLPEQHLYHQTHTYGRSGIIVEDSEGMNSVISDLTSSVIAGKHQQNQKHRTPTVVETIHEEPEQSESEMDQASVKSDKQDVKGVENVDCSVDRSRTPSQDDDLSNEQKGSPSIFLNIGCALTDSFQRVCSIPVNQSLLMNTVCPPNAGEMLKSRVRNLCSATDNSNTGTKPAASDNSNTEADRPGAQDETTTASATSGAKQQREQPEKGMNESERRVWKDWDERDEQAARQVGASNGRRPISDSSTLEVAMKKEQHGKLRDQAQNRLKQHVKKAMGILDDTAEDEGSTTVGPQPDSSANYPNEHIGQSSAHDLDDNATKSTTTKSTKSSYPAALSLEQTRMLTVFSAALRNEGVKVLKLNRHLKWQIRYLTVSREPVKIDGGFEKRDGDTQCPKGLLWLKQPNVNMQKHSSEKICGHGGLLFSELSSVDPVKDSIHASRISRKMQKLFPSFEGVSLKYSQEGVTREVLFCLQSEAEAEAFCTAVTIIKEVADRERSRVSVQSGA